MNQKLFLIAQKSKLIFLFFCALIKRATKNKILKHRPTSIFHILRVCWARREFRDRGEKSKTTLVAGTRLCLFSIVSARVVLPFGSHLASPHDVIKPLTIYLCQHIEKANQNPLARFQKVLNGFFEIFLIKIKECG